MGTVKSALESQISETVESPKPIVAFEETLIENLPCEEPFEIESEKSIQSQISEIFEFQEPGIAQEEIHVETIKSGESNEIMISYFDLPVESEEEIIQCEISEELEDAVDLLETVHHPVELDLTEDEKDNIILEKYYTVKSLFTERNTPLIFC